MNIPEYLVAYLKDNDSAELLDFGTFYASNVPSHFDIKTRVITPPCRSITFRSVRINNTRFLEYIAAKEFISFDTARILMQQYVTALKEQLDSQKQYRIGNIGTLSHVGDNNYNFSADRSLNLLDEAFAFVPLTNINVFDTEAPEKETPIVEETTAKAEPRPHPEETCSEITETEKETTEATTPDTEETPCENENEIQESVIAETEIVQSLENEEEETLHAEEEPTTTVSSAEEEERTSRKALKAQAAAEKKAEKESRRIAKEAAKAEKLLQKMEKKHSAQEKGSPFYSQMKASSRYTRKRRRGWLILSILLLLLIIVIILFFMKDGLNYVSKLVSDKTPRLTVAETPTVEPIPALPTDTLDIADTLLQDEENLPASVSDVKASTVQEPQKQEQKVVASAAPKPVIPKTIQQQDYSRKGFDIIGGAFSSLSNAEAAAKKAFAQGFQSYLIVKTEKGNNVYFVSYGSYRSLSEANRNLQEVINKTGSRQFYVKSF